MKKIQPINLIASETNKVQRHWDWFLRVSSDGLNLITEIGKEPVTTFQYANSHHGLKWQITGYVSRQPFNPGPYMHHKSYRLLTVELSWVENRMSTERQMNRQCIVTDLLPLTMIIIKLCLHLLLLAACTKKTAGQSQLSFVGIIPFRLSVHCIRHIQGFNVLLYLLLLLLLLLLLTLPFSSGCLPTSNYL